MTEADATGMTDADVRASASMDGRLEAIQHIAKRLCNSISEETDRLSKAHKTMEEEEEARRHKEAAAAASQRAKLAEEEAKLDAKREALDAEIAAMQGTRERSAHDFGA